MILGVDQVLLDLVINVDEDPGVFARYGLERNGQCLAGPQQGPLVSEVVSRSEQQARNEADGTMKGDSDIQRTPGGMVSNSMRASAWWLRQRSGNGQQPQLGMLGTVGRDTSGDVIRQELLRAGVTPLLQEKPGGGTATADHTGVCVCLIAGKSRTMIAELGAGKTQELHGGLPNWPGWTERIAATEKELGLDSPGGQPKPYILVLSAFYAQADPEGTRAVRDWCLARRDGVLARPILALGVSAEWCCNLPIVLEIAKDADLLFANEPECMALATRLLQDEGASKAEKVPQVEGSEAAIAIVQGWKERGWFVVTRGSKDVLAARAGVADAPVSVKVPAVSPGDFVDDIGAGDSFLGGFVADVWSTLAADPGQQATAPIGCGCCEGLSAIVAGKIGDSRNGEGNASGSDAKVRDPTTELLTEADMRRAMLAGIATAASCLKRVGCQFTV